jgi:hypothetical protein
LFWLCAPVGVWSGFNKRINLILLFFRKWRSLCVFSLHYVCCQLPWLVHQIKRVEWRKVTMAKDKIEGMVKATRVSKALTNSTT